MTAVVWRLSWAGQDFADAIVDDTLWHKAKETVLKPAGSWTFDVLKEWLKAEIGQGLPTLLDNFHAAPAQVQAGVKTTLGAPRP